MQDSPKTGTGDLLISVQAIEPLKIPVPNINTNKQIEELLNKMNYNAIYLLIYKLYGFDKEEIAFIESL